MIKIRLTILIVLCVLAIGVWVYPESIVHAHDNSRWVANVPGRTIPMCVANEDGSPINSEEMERVNAAFERAQKHPSFAPAGLNHGTGPRVVAGCSSGAAIRSTRGSITVDQPGAIQTYMFVIPSARLKESKFKHYPHVVGHEQMCGDAECNSVSNAVYITPEELDNPQELEKAILAGLGLEASEAIYVDGVTPDDKSSK